MMNAETHIRIFDNGSTYICFGKLRPDINGKGKGCEKCRAVREAARKESRGINVLGYYCERCHGVV